MPRKVIKRNGDITSFNEEKIKKAVNRAAISINEHLSEDTISAIIAYVSSHVEHNTTTSISKIQDLVEEGIMSIGEYQIAKAYILYRKNKDIEREKLDNKINKFKKKLEVEHEIFSGNKLREFVYLRTYSRWLEGEGRRETWMETVHRYMMFMKNELGDKLNKKVYEELQGAIFNMYIFPSMRLLWSAGNSAKMNNISAYNCSYMGIESPKDLADLMYILMSGAGVGCSIEKQFIDNFPLISPLDRKKINNEVVVIEDSKEGWAEAQRINIEEALCGREQQFDFSLIRPAGARLKISGGRSSGSGPLKDLLSYTWNKINSRRLPNNTSKLLSIDLYDIICKTAEVVVCGGTRRSALICLFDKNDQLMLSSKSGQFWKINAHRQLSNNSVVFNEKPTNLELLNFWKQLVEGSAGEPGFINREGMYSSMSPKRKESLSVSDRKQIGSNPCVPDYVSFLTPNGQKQLKELVIGDKIWDGNNWVNLINIIDSGIKPVFRYYTTKGVFDSTPNHVISSLGELNEIGFCDYIDLSCGTCDFGGNDYSEFAVLAGLILGDGSKQKNGGIRAYLNIGKNDNDIIPEIEKYTECFLDKNRSFLLAKLNVDFLDLHLKYAPLPERTISDDWMKANSSSMKLFLRGLFSANGTITGKNSKSRISLKSTCFDLIQKTQRMLSLIGIPSYTTTNKSKRIKFSNGEYLCKQSYDLNILQTEKFRSMIGFIQEYKTKRLNDVIKGPSLQKISFAAKITKKEYLGDIQVYDFTVDNNSHLVWCNGFKVKNCNEIIFSKSKGFCNLSTIIVREQDTSDDIKAKLKFATILGTFQATLTDFKYIDPKWKENCEKERLIGVSMTGIYDNAKWNETFSKENLEEYYKVVVNTNKEYAEKFGISPAAACTCEKPEGSSSLVVNSSSGIHPRYSPYYIRRIRVTSHDPLLHLMKDQGVPCYPEIGQSTEGGTTFVLEFPVKSPDNTTTFVSNISSDSQLNFIQRFKSHYTDHNVSATIHVKDNEWIKTLAWIDKNWNNLGGLAFLPKDDNVYQLAPFEEITEEEYNKRAEVLKNIDFSKLPYYEHEDNTTGAKEYACSGGKCEL